LAIASKLSNDEAGDGRRRIASLPVFWLLVAAITTLVLLLFREHLDKTHLALAYLLVVLGASAQAGGHTGFVLSITCFLCFNFFLLPPYYTLRLNDPLDWAVLGAFLLTGTVASRLLARAQQEAQAARQRAAEVDRFAQLGAESLNAPGAGAALDAIAHALRSELQVAGCEIYTVGADGAYQRAGSSPTDSGAAPGDEGVLRASLERGVVVVERADGSLHIATSAEGDGTMTLAGQEGARAIVLPLFVRGNAVGVLRLTASDGFSLDERQARFLAAMTYYAALGLERARLSAEAERAQGLREADRLKDALLASVSHDLRTPLTTIKALAAEMREQQADERAYVIEEEADRLNRLVTDVLDLSRIRAGALHPNAELIAAEDLLGAALQRLSGRTGYERIQPVIEDGGEILVGRFDFLQSLRVLVNLIENALLHAPPETAVIVRVSSSGDTIVFSVEDEGPGIAPEQRERIFLPFETGAGARAGGAGLGLAIARQLAEGQQGALHLSERPRGGSIFTLELPRATLPGL
jgi:two-component system sensor histidine kinase KdpD